MSELAYYKIPIPYKILNTFVSGHIVLLEKIIVPDGGPVAAGLIENKQPMYYMDNSFYMSENVYMGGVEGEYQLQFIRIDNNILNGAQNIRDYGIAEADDHIYGYRLMHLMPVTQTDGTIHYEEYISRYKCFKKVREIDKLETVYNKEHRLCLTERNISYRGRNDVNKYNSSLIETNSDIIILNKTYDAINSEIEDMTYVNEQLFTSEGAALLENSVNFGAGDYILDHMSRFYDFADKLSIIRHMKGY